MGPAGVEAALVLRARRGDADAFGELYDLHSPALRAWARRRVGPDAAEDLLHDVFLEAWGALSAFDPARGSFRSWMFARLRSRAIDRARARERRREVSFDGSPETPGAWPRPEAELERAEIQARLDALPPPSAAVLRLAYFEGLTLREIAEASAEPLGTIKARLSRALARLRDVLEEEAP